MKISGARTEGFQAMRRRAMAHAGARAVADAPPPDTTAFLGLAETELTPAVQAALQTLLTEIDDLRAEVARLKGRLAEAEASADRDGLTPLLNRRAFLRELGRVRAFTQRYGGAASLIYFDVDDLKSINDRFGHAAGDAALQAVAERLSANVRDSDLVGRMGGDEFAVVLVQADPPTAEAKAAALASAVEQPMSFGDWSAPLHVSYGVAQVAPDLDPERLLAEADEAMYRNKRARGGA